MAERRAHPAPLRVHRLGPAAAADGRRKGRQAHRRGLQPGPREGLRHEAAAAAHAEAAGAAGEEDDGAVERGRARRGAKRGHRRGAARGGSGAARGEGRAPRRGRRPRRRPGGERRPGRGGRRGGGRRGLRRVAEDYEKIRGDARLPQGRRAARDPPRHARQGARRRGVGADHAPRATGGRPRRPGRRALRGPRPSGLPVLLPGPAAALRAPSTAARKARDARGAGDVPPGAPGPLRRAGRARRRRGVPPEFAGLLPRLVLRRRRQRVAGDAGLPRGVPRAGAHARAPRALRRGRGQAGPALRDAFLARVRQRPPRLRQTAPQEARRRRFRSRVDPRPHAAPRGGGGRPRGRRALAPGDGKRFRRRARGPPRVPPGHEGAARPPEARRPGRDAPLPRRRPGRPRPRRHLSSARRGRRRGL